MHRNENYRFCPLCGGALKKKQIKEGEPKRLICSGCSYVFYIDPKIAACTIINIDGKIVMLKRAIPPSVGKWVIPGGFVDVGETVPAAAAREAWEEVGLEVEIGSLIGVYSYPETSVVIIVYEAEAKEGLPRAADEALAVDLFRPFEIPWDDIAFSSTVDAIKDYLKKHYPETLAE
ncbi:MAG: NUDIX hydrolase [Thermodesulfobacteriota bacterium]|nr:NUDIX hydrolase [Thermodesulfobacteriota bacterium]